MPIWYPLSPINVGCYVLLVDAERDGDGDGDGGGGGGQMRKVVFLDIHFDFEED